MSTHKVDLGLGHSKPENLNASLNHGRTQKVGNPVPRDALNTDKSKQKFASQLSNSLIVVLIKSSIGGFLQQEEETTKSTRRAPREQAHLPPSQNCDISRV